MGFIMINESFICENCGRKIEKDTRGWVRNHCPFCLYSKHLDKDFPWDRKSDCHWLMKPTGINNKKNKWWMIEHTCEKCRKKMLNKVSDDDNFIDFIKKMNTI